MFCYTVFPLVGISDWKCEKLKQRAERVKCKKCEIDSKRKIDPVQKGQAQFRRVVSRLVDSKRSRKSHAWR